MKGEQGPCGPMTGGVTFVRWGRTTCPNVEGTELVYKGRVAGSHYRTSGGGSLKNQRTLITVLAQVLR